MKKEKLALKELSINSFVTCVNENEKQTFEGGSFWQNTLEAIAHSFSMVKHICLPVEVTEATVSVASIVTSIIKSNNGADCAGATHLNCKETFSPCKV